MYKRQAVQRAYCGEHRLRRTPDRLSIRAGHAGRNPGAAGGCGLYDEKPVSYTHLDVYKRQVLIPLIVTDPQGKDLGLILLDEFMEGFDNTVGIGLLIGIVPGKEHRVDIHGVDDLLMACLLYTSTRCSS